MIGGLDRGSAAWTSSQTLFFTYTDRQEGLLTYTYMPCETSREVLYVLFITSIITGFTHIDLRPGSQKQRPGSTWLALFWGLIPCINGGSCTGGSKAQE